MSVNQRRIYVDLDDVLCETAQGFLTLLNSAYDRQVEFEEIVSFDLGRSFNLDQAAIDEFMHRAHGDEILLGLDPIAGSIETVAEWSRRGYAIEVVTGRPPSTEPVSRAWLARHEVPYESLTFLDKYSRLHSKEEIKRAKPLSELVAEDYCLAIEDSRDMAHYLSERLGLDVALIDRPWNRNGERPLSPAVVRCHGWRELRERFPEP